MSARVSIRPTSRWIKLVFAGLTTLLGALVATGFIYQAIASEVDERRYQPPGEMVDVGDTACT